VVTKHFTGVPAQREQRRDDRECVAAGKEGVEVIPASPFSVLADVRQYGVCARAEPERALATSAPVGDVVERLPFARRAGDAR
jgi:hypothetical protein